VYSGNAEISGLINGRVCKFNELNAFSETPFAG
jgi:hypothetical protein